MPDEEPQSARLAGIPSATQIAAGRRARVKKAERRRKGYWYFVPLALTLGILAAVPMFHAAVRLRDRSVFVLASIYSGVAALFLVASGARSDTETFDYVLASILLTALLVGTVHVDWLRRLVYGEEAQAPAKARHSAVRDSWWYNGGYWYYLFPIPSFGLLSAVPVLHAATRLRDRATLLFGLMYAAGAGLVVFLDRVYPGDASDRGNLGYMKGVLMVGMALYGTAQLTTLRRRVYGGAQQGSTEPQVADARTPTPQPLDGSPITTEGSEPSVSSDKDPADEQEFEEYQTWILATFALLVFVVFTLVIPAGMIVRTLSTHDSSTIRTDATLGNIAMVALALAVTAALLTWLVIGHNPENRILVDAALLAAAVVVNVHLGFAVWLLSVRILGIEPAVSDSRSFGLMVWWNLADSIPLIDVDSALDWERPISENGAEIGWLLLLQRTVLLLTLARAVQLFVNRWLNSPSAGGLRRNEGPKDPGLVQNRE